MNRIELNPHEHLQLLNRCNEPDTSTIWKNLINVGNGETSKKLNRNKLDKLHEMQCIHTYHNKRCSVITTASQTQPSISNLAHIVISKLQLMTMVKPVHLQHSTQGPIEAVALAVYTS